MASPDGDIDKQAGVSIRCQDNLSVRFQAGRPTAREMRAAPITAPVKLRWRSVSLRSHRSLTLLLVLRPGDPRPLLSAPCRQRLGLPDGAGNVPLAAHFSRQTR
ncbi:hypothetical protein ACWDZ4_13750 [Streptomyces sp. NPDC003016]